MSEFLAEAQVVVRANTKLFVADFEKAVKKVEATKVSVIVRADMKGFQADLRTKVTRSSRGVVAKIPVRPDMTGFRVALQAAVTRASRGVVADVSVRAGAVTKGAAAAAAAPVAGVTTGAVVDRRVAAAQLALNAATNAGVAARRRITAAISDEERFSTRLEREQLHLKAATDAVARAAIAGVPEMLALAEAEERAARAALALSAAQEQRRALGVPVGVTTAAFLEQEAAAKGLAEAEALHGEAIKRNAAVDDAATKKILADQKARLAGITKEAAALQARAAVAGKAARQAQVAASGVTRTGAPIGDEAVARNAAAIESARVAKTVEADLARSRRTASAAATLVDNEERKLSGTRSALRLSTDAVILAEENYERALATEIPTVIALRDAELQRARAQQAALATTTTTLEKSVATTGLLTAGRRALVAQIANLTGLRGAALTAASGFIVASAAFIGFRKAVGLASDLEDELAVFNVTAGATADQMKTVHETAIDLGKDLTLPGVSASDAAVALTELSKAGLSVQDSIDGARGVLQLATAANIDFTQATNLTASALNAFGLAGEAASHVADVLANSANESQGSITDAGVALQQSAAVARQAGLTLEQTVAALTLFARAGLRGSDAGTSLRTALIRLINPSAKAQDVIGKLGLRIRDAQGNIDLGVFQQFTDATKNLTKAQRDQALAVVFGQDAIRGAAILAREGTRGLNTELAAIEKTGTAEAVAAARTQGLSGALENLKNQLSTTGVVLGEALLPTLKLIVDEFANAFEGINSTIEQLADLRKQAAKPIDIVVNFISKPFGGGDTIPGEDKSFLDRAGARVKETLTGTSLDMVQRFIKDTNNAQDAWIKFLNTVQDPLHVQLTTFPSMDKAKKEVADTVKQFNAFQDEPGLNVAINRLTKLQKELQGGTDDSKAFAKELSPLLEILQKMARVRKIRPITPPEVPVPGADTQNLPTLFGTQLPKGTDLAKPLIDAADKAKKGLREHLGGNAFSEVVASSFDRLVAATRTGGDAFAEAGEITTGQFASRFQAGLSHAFLIAVNTVQRGQQALTDAMNQAVVSGAGPQTLLGILKQQLDAQNKIIADANLRLSQLGPGDLKSAKTKAKVIRSAALDRAAAITEQIKSTTEGIASQAQQDAQEAKDARDKADQAVLAAFSAPESALDLKDTTAAGTERLQDDLDAAKARRALLTKEVATIDSTFKDRKAAATEIASRATAIQAQTNTINGLIKQINDQVIEGAPAFQAQLSLAQAQGNIPLQIRLINVRIKAIDGLIKAHKAEGAELNKLKAARATLQGQLNDLGDQQFQDRLALAQDGGAGIQVILKIFDRRIAVLNKAINKAKEEGRATEALRKSLQEVANSRRDAFDEFLSKQTELAKLTFGDTDNTSPIVRALNREIANKRKEIAQAKKAHKATIDLRIQLQTLINDRKAILNDAKDEAGKGTSVFDLLKQNVDLFNKTAGNLINQNQPFVGAFGFTADIAQFLTRRPGAGGNITPSATQAQPGRMDLNDQPLIQAIDRWIATINQQTGNRSTGGTGATISGTPTNPWAVARWFGSADQARGAVEG